MDYGRCLYPTVGVHSLHKTFISSLLAISVTSNERKPVLEKGRTGNRVAPHRIPQL
jgi:hypothetical protein